MRSIDGGLLMQTADSVTMIRDEEVIEAANEAGMAMVFTGERHFKH